MNYKTTNKYFTQKNLLMHIGMGIAAVGLFSHFSGGGALAPE